MTTTTLRANMNLTVFENSQSESFFEKVESFFEKVETFFEKVETFFEKVETFFQKVETFFEKVETISGLIGFDFFKNFKMGLLLRKISLHSYFFRLIIILQFISN